jgi:hypothetical protein
MSRARTRGTAEVLDGVFRHALLLALGAPVLTGCGKADGIEHEPGFVAAPCDDTGQPKYLEGLDPSPTADGMLLTRQVSDQPLQVLEQVGTPCSNASDEHACQVDFYQSRPVGFTLGTYGQLERFVQLRVSRGDEVQVITAYDQLREFLAPVNTPAEAVLAASDGYDVRCGRAGSRPVADGFEVQLFAYPGCDGRTRYLLHVDADGNVSKVSSEVEHEADPGCVVGRRPAGLELCSLPERDELAAHFARSAELEAASVQAFATLISELRAHGAPASLLARAARAGRDEVRHARDVARLARSFGGRVRPPRVTCIAPRSLEEVALENAVEGCVRETYGALIAAHQARCAADRRVRALYARIARDETRHAALSLDVAAWAAPKLSAAARQRVDMASRRTLAALHDSLQTPFAEALISAAGLPRPEVATALLQQLHSALSARGVPGWAS